MKLIYRIAFALALFGLFLVIVNERLSAPSMIGSVMVGVGVGILLVGSVFTGEK